MALKRTTLTLESEVLAYFRGIGGGSASKGMRIVASGSAFDDHKPGRPKKQGSDLVQNNAYNKGHPDGGV